jgi:hypothetical protein
MTYNRIKNSLHSKIIVHSNDRSNGGLSRIQLWAKKHLYLPWLQTPMQSMKKISQAVSSVIVICYVRTVKTVRRICMKLMNYRCWCEDAADLCCQLAGKQSLDYTVVLIYIYIKQNRMSKIKNNLLTGKQS